jgi:peptidoglycan/LPS O-acetylase OafA/YrhL
MHSSDDSEIADPGTREYVAENPSHKLHGIEVVRFLSAMAVLLWHYQNFNGIGHTAPNLSRMQAPFYAQLSLFYSYGFYAVQVFWCTSGFIFFYKYRDSIADLRVQGKAFFIRRFSRLYPLHIATLIAVAGLEPVYHLIYGEFFIYIHNDVPHFITQFFMVGSWGLTDANSFNGPIWSVSTEIVVYGIFFVILRYVGKSVSLHCIVLITSIVTMYVISRFTVESYLFSECVSFFYLGGLSAVASRHRFAKGTSRAAAYGLVCLLGSIAPLAACLIWPTDQRCLILTLAGITLPALLFCAASVTSRNHTVQLAIETAGNLTYSSYLLQFPIQLTIVIVFSYCQTAIPVDSKVFWASYITGTLLLSFLSYRYFEHPAQMAIRRWAKRFSRNSLAELNQSARQSTS